MLNLNSHRFQRIRKRGYSCPGHLEQCTVSQVSYTPILRTWKTSIPVWISNHMPIETWNEITSIHSQSIKPLNLGMDKSFYHTLYSVITYACWDTALDTVSDWHTDLVVKIIMTPSNGNIFCVTGHLCGEFTGRRRIPLTTDSNAELWCFLWTAPEQTVE